MNRCSKIVFGVLLAVTAYADRVDLIANFNIQDIPIEWSKMGENRFDLLNLPPDIRSAPSPDLKRIVVMNNCLSPATLAQLPKEKLVLFMWEPDQIDPSYYQWFSRIYTWDDNLVDGIKFFKFYYPYLTAFPNDLPSFEQKKFCTMIASHWTIDRLEMIFFFRTKPVNDFDFYGVAQGELAKSKQYCGPIRGYHSGPEKIAVLKKYKFCICFENTTHLNGYITEKIQNCFAAGCVPIYWGAPNIASYIPKECYIDYRDFQSEEELYSYLKTMTATTYEQYLNAIQQFVASEEALLFSPKCFEQIFYEATMYE